MKKNLFSLLACLLFFTSAFATKHTVTVSDFVFTPDSLSFPLGDTIVWQWLGGTHNVASKTAVGDIPAGAAPWNAPITSGTPTFIYVPTVVGTYNYLCTIHPTQMNAKFVVTTPASVPNIPGANNFVEIIPNPAITNVRIKTNLQHPEIGVYDCTGKLVTHQSVQTSNSGEFNLNIENYPVGVYIIRVSSVDGVCQQRLLIAH